MKTALLTVVVCIIALIAGGYGFIYSGVYDVAAVHPDNPLVAKIIHEASDRAVAARLSAIEVPGGLDKPETIAAGAKIYGETCVVCHGGPGIRPSFISVGLNPTPPDLFRGSRHPDPQENDWFITNGVKMTGMPGFAASLTPDQVWSLVAFLNSAPGMTAADFSAKTGITVAAAPQPVAAKGM